MKLYYSPGACSLAAHIALVEGGFPFEIVKVDLKSKTSADGRPFSAINPKGYVPALEFDGGEVLTENVALLTWIADQDRAGLVVAEPVNALARYRRLEMLAFISTELHKSFKPFFSPDAKDAAKQAAANVLAGRFGYVGEQLTGDFLFGSRPEVADDYLYVMLTWARKNRLEIPHSLAGFMDRMNARPAVMQALSDEGLPSSLAAA